MSEKDTKEELALEVIYEIEDFLDLLQSNSEDLPYKSKITAKIIILSIKAFVQSRRNHFINKDDLPI